MSEQTFVSDEWIGTQVLSLFPNLDTQYQKTDKEEDLLYADIFDTAQLLSQAIDKGKSVFFSCIWTETYLEEYGKLDERLMFGAYVAKLGKVVVYDEGFRKSPDTNDFHLPSIEEAEFLSIITGAKGYKDISFPAQGIQLFHPWLSVGKYYDYKSGGSRKCRSYSAEHQYVRLYEPCDFIRTYIYQLRLPSWYRKNITEDIKAAQSVHSIKGAPNTNIAAKNKKLLLDVLDAISMELSAAYEANDFDSVKALKNEWAHTQERLKKAVYTETYKNVFDARLSHYYPNNINVFYINVTKAVELIRQWKPTIKPVDLGAILGKSGLFEDCIHQNPDVWRDYKVSSYLIQRTSPDFYQELLRWHKGQCNQIISAVEQPVHDKDFTNAPATDWDRMTSENNDIQEYLKQHPDKVKEYNEWLINNL